MRTELGLVFSWGLGVLLACTSEVVPEGEGCVTCHAGIEQVHQAIPAGECTLCHGGNPNTTELASAHIPIPANWEEIRGPALPPAPPGFIKDFAPDQLDALPLDYLQFINPGDTRVVTHTCGRCHADKARTMPSSVMNTNAGHYYPSLFLADLQPDRIAQFGSFRATDPDCDLTIPGTVCSLETIKPPDASQIQAAIDSGDSQELARVATYHYLAKNCNTCHQAGYPRNDSPGLYRSTGCSSCHMLYSDEGVYEGGDPTIPRGSPVHGSKHVLTKAIPSEQCAHCHFQGGRIGLLYRGIREGGFSQRPPNAEVIEQTLYGRAPGFYILDEDTTNGVDETPADVHFQRGMHCADCHVGSDVHGTGRLYSSSKLQLDIRCEDCHGTIRAPVSADSDGRFVTSRGRPLPQLRDGERGEVVLTGIVDGVEHVVPQVAEIIARGTELEMIAAMGEDDSGWSHTDSLTCDTCHTSYNEYCIGCHVSMDLRLSQVDYQTGLRTPGLTRGGRSTYTLNHLLLGVAPDGRVQTVHPSQQLQLAVIGADEFGTENGAVLMGNKVVDAMGRSRTLGEFRRRESSVANNGFVPFFQHTASKKPRPCSACHRRDDSASEEARVRGVYGFGTGEFMLPGPDGRLVDGLQFLDATGNATTTWVHPGTGPLPRERLERALGVILPP